MKERTRNYLKNVEDYVSENPTKKLHFSRNCNGTPIFEECGFEYQENDTFEKSFKPEDIVFILSDGSIILKTEESPAEVAMDIIKGNVQYTKYFMARYEKDSLREYALEFLVRYASALYFDADKKEVYHSKYAGAFTSYEEGLWKYAVRNSDLFDGYNLVEIDNKAEDLDAHMEF